MADNSTDYAKSKYHGVDFEGTRGILAKNPVANQGPSEFHGVLEPLRPINTNIASAVPMDPYEAEFRRVFESAMKLYRAKTADYGSSWRHHGAEGVYIRLSDKMARLETLFWKRKTQNVTGEGIMDTARDMLPYVLMLIYCLEKGEVRGEAK